MNILFVCQGNVGRSQMAEAIFNTLTHGGHEVVSAGTRVIKGDDTSRVGQILKETESSGNVLAVLSEIGIDGAHLKRKPLTPEMVEHADKVIVMAERETVPDYVRQSPKVEHWDIADPFMQSREFTRDIRNQIQTYIEDLIAAME